MSKPKTWTHFAHNWRFWAFGTSEADARRRFRSNEHGDKKDRDEEITKYGYQVVQFSRPLTSEEWMDFWDADPYLDIDKVRPDNLTYKAAWTHPIAARNMEFKGERVERGWNKDEGK
tara:strand:+ start:100 stop:450 length:351 start_codon:yes stop_codon:yes gene_type:complete